MTRQCPYPGCESIIPRDRFACKPHWYALPAAMRSSINAAWRSGDYTELFEQQKQAKAEWDGQIAKAKQVPRGVTETEYMAGIGVGCLLVVILLAWGSWAAVVGLKGWLEDIADRAGGKYQQTSRPADQQTSRPADQQTTWPGR